MLALQRMAGNRATLALLRQPVTEKAGGCAGSRARALRSAQPGALKVSDGRDKNEMVIERPDGTKYHVFHRIRAQKLSRPGAPRAGFCRDDERVYLRFAWCEGTQRRRSTSAPTRRARQEDGQGRRRQARNGGSVDDVIDTLENLTVQPFAEAEIAEVGSWKITGDFKVDVNKNGFGTPKAGIKGDSGWAEVGVDISGKDVNVNVRSPPASARCRARSARSASSPSGASSTATRRSRLTGTIRG